MSLDEILRILQESGEFEDIQGVSRDGPFTITWTDGTRDEVTLAELQQLAEDRGPQALPGGGPTAQAQPRPSTTLVPGGPGPTEKPDWWDESVDGDWEAQEWDTRKYGQYPFKANKDGEVTGPDYAAAESQRKRVDARMEKEEPDFKGFATREEAQARADELGEGFDVAYDSKTNTFRVQESTETREAEVVTLDGQRFIQQPGGNVSAFPEERRRSLDDMLIGALEAGDLAEQERVLNLMDRVEALRNRPRPMNDAEIFEFLAPIAQNPQHFEELLRAFRQDVGQQVPMVSMGDGGQPASSQGQGTQVGVPQGGQAGGQGQIEAIQAEMQALGRMTPMTPESLARLNALGQELRVLQVSQERERGQVQVPQGQAAPPTEAPLPANVPPAQVGLPGIVKQGAAFGGTEFFPIPQGNVLQEKFARSYNEQQQERFKRRRVPQVSFR